MAPGCPASGRAGSCHSVQSLVPGRAAREVGAVYTGHDNRKCSGPAAWPRMGGTRSDSRGEPRARTSRSPVAVRSDSRGGRTRSGGSRAVDPFIAGPRGPAAPPARAAAALATRAERDYRCVPACSARRRAGRVGDGRCGAVPGRGLPRAALARREPAWAARGRGAGRPRASRIAVRTGEREEMPQFDPPKVDRPTDHGGARACLIGHARVRAVEPPHPAHERAITMLNTVAAPARPGTLAGTLPRRQQDQDARANREHALQVTRPG